MTMNEVSMIEVPPADTTAGQLSERYTIAQLTQIFIGADDKIDELKKQISKLSGQLEMIRGAIAMKMDANQLTNVKTPYGTPYFSTFESIRVGEREIFFDWVFEHRASDVLTSAVSKDSVRERSERGENIPGLHIETFRRLRVLRK